MVKVLLRESSNKMMETESLLQNMNLSGLQVRATLICFFLLNTKYLGFIARLLTGHSTVATILRRMWVTWQRMGWCRTCTVLAKCLQYPVLMVQVRGDTCRIKYLRECFLIKYFTENYFSCWLWQLWLWDWEQQQLKWQRDDVNNKRCRRIQQQWEKTESRSE